MACRTGALLNQSGESAGLHRPRFQDHNLLLISSWINQLTQTGLLRLTSTTRGSRIQNEIIHGYCLWMSTPCFFASLCQCTMPLPP